MVNAVSVKWDLRNKKGTFAPEYFNQVKYTTMAYLVQGGGGLARRNTHLEKHGISHDKYMELKYFCKQYPEKKERLYSLSDIKAINYTGMPHGSDTGNPTERQAILREQLIHDMELVEQTAIEADSDIYQEIISNVTQGISYFYLDVPCSKDYFYKARDKFFILLSFKK